jgi:hypothetical protein
MKCPICYGDLDGGKCQSCNLAMTEFELIKLKAATYDSIIEHLLEAGKDARRREQARCRIALRNIKRWAENNLE